MALSSRDARMREPDDELTAKALGRREEGRLTKPESALESRVSTCSRQHSGCDHGPQSQFPHLSRRIMQFLGIAPG